MKTRNLTAALFVALLGMLFISTAHAGGAGGTVGSGYRSELSATITTPDWVCKNTPFSFFATFTNTSSSTTYTNVTMQVTFNSGVQVLSFPPSCVKTSSAPSYTCGMYGGVPFPSVPPNQSPVPFQFNLQRVADCSNSGLCPNSATAYGHVGQEVYSGVATSGPYTMGCMPPRP